MTLTQDETDLLKSLRREVIPDPLRLAAEHDRLTREIEAGDADWERYDRRGDASAFLQLQPLAERLQALRARAKTLPAQKADAERRQAAFLDLARRFEAVGRDVQAQLDAMLDHPPADAQERVMALKRLDEAGRLWIRLAWHLQAVSTDRRFREPPDVLKVLREELETRVREIERLRVPGGKPKFVAPPEIAALLMTLDAGRKEHTA
jgi:hypothetical protein